MFSKHTYVPESVYALFALAAVGVCAIQWTVRFLNTKHV